MNRKKTLLQLVVLMFLIFAFDRLAHNFYWYTSIWWFDMPMHYFGGLWVGLFFSYLFFKDKSILKIILCVLTVGVLWEFFEIFANNFIGHDVFNTLDTISDLFFDLAGGLTATFYLFKSIMSVEQNKL